MSNKRFTEKNEYFQKVVSEIVESGFSEKAIKEGIAKLEAANVSRVLIDIIAGCVPMKP